MSEHLIVHEPKISTTLSSKDMNNNLLSVTLGLEAALIWKVH